MFNNVALDVFIGLIFVFLLYSLFATIIQELIATQLAFRSKVLEKAIIRMLEDGKSTTIFPWFDRVRAYFNILIRSNSLKNKRFASAFYVHPLIKFLAEDNFFSKPAYLSAKNFSKILVDILHGLDADTPAVNLMRVQQTIRTGKLNLPPEVGNDPQNPADIAYMEIRKKDQEEDKPDIGPETRLFLRNMLVEAQGDIEKFRRSIEQWFDDTMERTSGWYKRYTQVVLFILGFIIALSFNVDTISIAKKLSRDSDLRDQMVASANAYLDKTQSLGNQLKEIPKDSAGYKNVEATYAALTERTNALLKSSDSLLNTDIKNVNEVMGLGYDCSHPRFSHVFFWTKPDVSAKNVAGWILTALAICLGAPFWFDMLNKLTKLRSGGTKITTDESTSNTTAKSANQPIVVNVNNTPGGEAVG